MTTPQIKCTFVGTGVSTAIPCIAHAVNDNSRCACVDAASSPVSKNRRNNVSMLVQEFCEDLNLEEEGDDVAQKASFPPKTQEEEEEEKQEKTQEKKEEENEKEQEQEQKEKEKLTPRPGFGKNVLIDCGKTFRDSFFRVLAPRKIHRLAAVVITHEHADAVSVGIDELRDLQKFECVAPQWFWKIQEAIPFFCSHFCLETVTRGFGYIVRNSRLNHGYCSKRVEGFDYSQNDGYQISDARKAELELDKKEGRPHRLPHGEEEVEKNNNSASASATTATEEKEECVASPFLAKPWKPYIIERRITALDIYRFDEDAGPFEFKVTPGNMKSGNWFGVPAEHGARYLSCGFVFGDPKNNSRVVYLSDISRASGEVMRFLKSKIVGKIELLVVDGLLPFGEKTHFSHYTLDQAWELTKELDPVVSRTVGMWCEVHHDPNVEKMKEMVKLHREKNPNCRLKDFSLAFDGEEMILGGK